MLHKSIRKRLPQRETAVRNGKGPDKQALLSLGTGVEHTLEDPRALRSREMVGRLDFILLSSLQGSYILCEYCLASTLLTQKGGNQGSEQLLTEGKPEFSEGLDRRKEKAQQLEFDDDEGCVAVIETMCSQYIKKQSKEKKPVV